MGRAKSRVCESVGLCAGHRGTRASIRIAPWAALGVARPGFPNPIRPHNHFLTLSNSWEGGGVQAFIQVTCGVRRPAVLSTNPRPAVLWWVHLLEPIVIIRGTHK